MAAVTENTHKNTHTDKHTHIHTHTHTRADSVKNMTAVSLHNIQLTLAILDSLWQYLNWLKRSSLCVLNDFQVIIDILLLYIVMWNPYSYPDLASLFHGNYKDLYKSVLKFIWQYHVIPNFVCICLMIFIVFFYYEQETRYFPENWRWTQTS